MIERYRDHFVTSLFSDMYRYSTWRNIEVAYLEARLENGDTTFDKRTLEHIRAFRVPSPEQVATEEKETGHDVVAFLNAWTLNMSPHAQSVIHRGLTSSDLVENTLFLQLRAMVEVTEQNLIMLQDRLLSLEDDYRDSPRVGRTHGQVAEPTNAGHRFKVWRWTVGALRNQAGVLLNELSVFKTPGAVGNARLLGEAVALRAAYAWASNTVGLVPSTQVIPRQRMILWAGWMVAVASLVEEIALEIRLSSRSEVQELQEGAADDRVGSSAVPGKRNPIGSERLSGMGRLVRSNFAAIAETAGALHHERDISNSSVERVAVPDMSHLVTFMLNEILVILDDLKINAAIMGQHVHQIRDTAWIQYALQGLGLPYRSAQAEAAKWAADSGWDIKRVVGLINDRRDEVGMALITNHDFLKAVIKH